jgi:hypothetical protein
VSFLVPVDAFQTLPRNAVCYLKVQGSRQSQPMPCLSVMPICSNLSPAPWRGPLWISSCLQRQLPARRSSCFRHPVHKSNDS